MHPSSRESSRSNISKIIQPSHEYHDPTPSAFNESFYQEKQSQNYTSYEYIKRYLNETNLSFTIEKMMGILLKMQKLPENPYNLMYRLIHHEAIYENLRRFYNQEREFENMINHNLQLDDEDANYDPNDHIDNFRKLRLKDKEVMINSKIANYINPTNVFVFSKIVDSRRIAEKNKVLIDKFNFKNIFMSFGGPITLNLRGNRGQVQVPGKLPKQQGERSLYCSEAMLTCTLYVNSGREISKSFQQFAEYILEDLKESIQYKDENYTIYLQKLELFNIDEIFNLIQFSREQIINNSITVQKEIMKSIQKQNMIIRAKCVYRLSKDLMNVIGQEFITVYKEYVLIAKVEDNLTILSNEPLKYALREAFIHHEALSIILDHEQYRHKNLFDEFRIEMMHTLTHNLKNQNLAQLAWDLFYCILFENSQKENSQLLQDLNQTISYILLSPISFVYKLIYTLKCVKWLALPSFPTLSENQAYQLIINAENQITAYIQRGNYIYWELEIFYEAIKRLLSIIVEFKQLKINSIVFIIDHALLMLNGVTVNFTQILLVLQGNVLSYINVLRSASKEEKEEIGEDSIVSYENFIKNKELPTRVLKLQDEIKKGKKLLNLSENQVKTIIMAKYVNKYDLYSKIYSFYWELFIGKKPNYPLSNFLKLLMINSTQCSYDLFKENYAKPKYKIEVNPINEINIYEISNPQTSYVFYSLSPSSLNLYTLKQYKTVLEMIKPFFEEQGTTDNGLGFRYGSRTTIQTNQLGNTNEGRKRNTVTIGVKSIEIGDNIGEQINSFNQCKLLIDIILYRSFNNKFDLYSQILQYLYELMDRLDKDNYSVLGLYSYYENHYNILSNDEFIYTKILNQENIIRFDYKKKPSMDKFIKFVDTIITQGKFIEMKVIYTLREIPKVIKLSFNFYYKHSSQNQYLSLFKPNFILERIYSSKRELLTWGEVSNYKIIKEYVNSNKVTSKENILQSLKKLHDEKEVSIIDIISEKEVAQRSRGGREEFSKQRYYKQSSFYNLFQRSLEMIENMQILIDYLKTDRRGRYELSHLRKIYDLLRYYLIDRCLIKDDFIYSEGTAVSIVNLMSYIGEYLEKHPDNNGEERELLYLERVITKLGNLVKFEEISCSICIYESINLKNEEIMDANQ